MSHDSLFTELAQTHCPYCDAPITLIIDPIKAYQSYVEDCEVCCRPMEVTTEDGQLIDVKREDD
jgi:hypothetical protein